MVPTGIVHDPVFFEHRTEPGHPETAKRLSRIYASLEDRLDDPGYAAIAPRPARREELSWAHSAAYVATIAASAQREWTRFTADTHASARSFEAARQAAGGLMAAIDRVVAGQARNAMVLARPPGHHAERNRAMGYCLFNGVALGACFARRSLGLQRVLILDWDVHHGNGTQHIFDDDPTVLFFSLHQSPHFPGTGAYTETGWGPGAGYTVNIPLSRGYGDAEYTLLLATLLPRLARSFEPELILVSAGFDTHRKDPLGGMKMSSDGFAALTRIVMDTAAQCCLGRLVLFMEGGYHPPALARSVHAVLDELGGKTLSDPAAVGSSADSRLTDPVFQRCAHVQAPHWPGLGSL